MKKVVMNLEDYKGKYVMHCPTEESAKLFCEFLHKNGRRWLPSLLYTAKTYWSIYGVRTVYFFNQELYGEIIDAEMKGYKILEIEDFIQEIRL